MISVRRLKRVQAILELALIVCAALYAARPYFNNDPQKVLIGMESQWLTSSAFSAAHSLRADGRIALWQPWLGHGEPTVENPFSFTLNPISTAPSLLYGPENGPKYSAILYVIFAGLGGWVLGAALGLGGVGRVLLGLICIGRGNMPAVLDKGYYQLGVTQAYFPWVTAAIVGLIRFPMRRWPVALLAIMLTLLFWAGNIYYTLPMLIIIVVLTLVFAVRVEQQRLRFDSRLLRRVLLALLLTAGLAAATLLPIFAHQQYIGGHPNESPNSVYETLVVAARQFFTSDVYYQPGTWAQNYFSFVLPVWFALIIFVLLPVGVRRLRRSADPQMHPRFVATALFLIVFFLIWGTRSVPLVLWLYEHIPLLGQWRVVSRMLTLSAFWIGVLVALRVDALWRALVIDRRLNLERIPWLKRITLHLHQLIGAGLLVACALMAAQLLNNWALFGYLDKQNPMNEQCVQWLRTTHPNANLSVFANDYYQVAAYLNRDVRFAHINADYHPLGMTPTIYSYDLTKSPPEYLISFYLKERNYWLQHGYTFMLDSPKTDDHFPCVMHTDNALSYAFTIPEAQLNSAPDPLPPSLTHPVGLMQRRSDVIGLIASGDPHESSVLVVQELAWPGWRVTVDGAPAKLESVGQMIGVILPPGQTPHRVLFVYDPPLFKLGGLITLLCAGLIALYLLHADRFLRRRTTQKTETISS